LIPVVSFTGPALAALLAGAVVVEKVFAIPGWATFLSNQSSTATSL
jgi:ABC-type dipeptide/oligopeptide/nickel transport system permease component